MQTGTVLRLWFCGICWGFKIHFWRNNVHFWKSYICSNELDVSTTSFSFTQFNTIRNHLFGRWIEIRRTSCSRIVGSDCFCFGKHDSDNRENGATCYHWLKSRSQGKINVLNNVVCVLPNVQSSHQEAFVVRVWRTTKQWSRWSLKEGVPQWDMFPGPTGLRLIGCSIELTWTQKSKSSRSTPKTNALTF